MSYGGVDRRTAYCGPSDAPPTSRSRGFLFQKTLTKKAPELPREQKEMRIKTCPPSGGNYFASHWVNGIIVGKVPVQIHLAATPYPPAYARRLVRMRT